MALFFRNGYWETVWIAFAYYDPGCGAANQNFRKQGWWRLDPSPAGSAVLNAWDTDLRRVNRYAYFYAATANIASEWSGAGNGWLTVSPAERFERCAFDSPERDLWVNFIELDFMWAHPGWDFFVTLWNWQGVNRRTFSQGTGNWEHTPIPPAPGWG